MNYNQDLRLWLYSHRDEERKEVKEKLCRLLGWSEDQYKRRMTSRAAVTFQDCIVIITYFKIDTKTYFKDVADSMVKFIKVLTPYTQHDNTN